MSNRPADSDPVSPFPYRVAYSERVQNHLRDLIDRAKARGLAEQVLAALRDIDHRLHIYPQFGDPLRKLNLEPAELWIGCVPPLVVRYFLHEALRLVMVVVPIDHLPNSGLDP
jgi:hypothetical protein